MSFPPRFEVQFNHQVCKYRKSLYGLKQSPKAWFDKFTTFVKSQGYTHGHSNHKLFTKRSESRKIVVLIVYVNDIVSSCDDITEITRLKRKMGEEFEIKDLGNLKYFLGMEVSRSSKGISVSQREYTPNLLKKICLTGCRLTNTPVKLDEKLGSSVDKVPTNKEKYHRLVSKLIYLSHTRLDISYAISAVNQFMQAPYKEHMEFVNRILRYLKTTLEKGKY
ncbi:putative mitochondrial protein [Cucumis melo var. makuwa]|uniref:Mitochondrial protein n=1 Tax=Cucumis melo var. makuwa TaxID=1194695 RepID=A0A5A7USK4_CUCMM|nr:putative mitochondrial protein [Cucumis melo var. makuwa]TYK23721.1 putative mitochondrial protein [Cucumis melo var. makuwa]